MLHRVIIMVDLSDFQGFGKKFRSEIDRIDQHHPEDRQEVKQFVAAKDGRVKESTLAQYLTVLRRTSDRLNQPITTLTQEEFDQFIFDVRHDPELGRGDEPGLSDRSAQNIQFTVRVFLKWLHPDERGSKTHWAYGYEPLKIDDDTVTADQMLLSDHIQRLTDAAPNLRDIALIEFFADSGARLSLVGSLRVGDVDLDGERATYTPNSDARGLKGAGIKPYPIIDARAPLRAYLRQTHPRPDDPDVALFHKLAGHGNDFSGDGSLSPTGLKDRLRMAADKADVNKPINPHNFRHSAITRMVREGYTRSQIEHRVHWSIDSDMWEVYEHITSEEHNDDIFRRAGLGDDDADGPSAERHPCGNCREPLAPHHAYCPRCGAAATPETRELQDKAQDSLGRGMATIEDMDRREFRALVARELRLDPSKLGQADSPSEDSRSR